MLCLQSIAPADEMCNPEVFKCKTATYVYESQCKACFGTGTIRGRSNGRRGALSTCPHCVGVGESACDSAALSCGNSWQQSVCACSLVSGHVPDIWHVLAAGYVRRATTRFAPNVCEEGPHLSLNRDPSANTKDQKLSG
jgi:hypothetical protein